MGLLRFLWSGEGEWRVRPQSGGKNEGNGSVGRSAVAGSQCVAAPPATFAIAKRARHFIACFPYPRRSINPLLLPKTRVFMLKLRTFGLVRTSNGSLKGPIASCQKFN